MIVNSNSTLIDINMPIVTPEHSEIYYRQQAEKTLVNLEKT